MLPLLGFEDSDRPRWETEVESVVCPTCRAKDADDALDLERELSVMP